MSEEWPQGGCLKAHCALKPRVPRPLAQETPDIPALSGAASTLKYRHLVDLPTGRVALLPAFLVWWSDVQVSRQVGIQNRTSSFSRHRGRWE